MKQKYTSTQVALELVAVLLILATAAFLLIRWPLIPEQIPGHYNAAGQIDRWGGKSEIIVLPAVAIILYGLLTAISFFPSLWNVPVAITGNNKRGVYSRMKTMLLILKAEMLAVFSFLAVNTSMAKPLPNWLLPLSLAVVFGSVICGVINVCQYARKSTIQ
jgi:uncharacterized membrane protein